MKQYRFVEPGEHITEEIKCKYGLLDQAASRSLYHRKPPYVNSIALIKLFFQD
jgi:hypothetical protein